MDREFIMNLKSAGCRFLVFGLECGSQRILDIMKKNIKLDWAVKNFQDCKDAGISVHVNMIVGFPGEEEEDFQLTLDFMKKVIKNIDVVNMGVGMSVGEGQDVYIHPERYDLLLNSIGKVEFDDDGQWSSKDGRNSHTVRQDRLKRLRRFLHNYEVFVNPVISNPEIM
jgi:hypothetical protein